MPCGLGPLLVTCLWLMSVTVQKSFWRGLPRPHGCVLEWEGFFSELHQGMQLPLLVSPDCMARGADVNIRVDAVNTIPSSDLNLSLRCLRATFYTLEGGLYMIYQRKKVNDYRTLNLIPK